MKATIAGLIPNAPISAYISQLILAGACLMSYGVKAGVDDWPNTAFYAPHDPVAEFGDAEQKTMMALACLSSVQISLDQNGQAVVTPGMLVPDPDFPIGLYSVNIMGPLLDIVTCDEIGVPLMAVVTELPTGNTCMSELHVEDKLRPVMACEDDTIPCNSDLLALNYLEFLEFVEDNCDDEPSVYFEYTITELNCDPNGIAGYVDITYHATDDYGNHSSCHQFIYLEKFDLGDVVFPNDTSINCDGANTDPEVIGGPTIGGAPIHHFCELMAWKTDNIVPMCSGQYKINRLWRVMDWCTGEQITDPQVILVIDTVPPEIVCPNDVTLGTSLLQCSASYTFPSVVVTDVCSDEAFIDVWFTNSEVPGIFYTGNAVVLDTGVHTVTVHARDDCNNTSTCQYTVTVVDDDNPVVVCSNLNITLDQNGMAFLNANSPAFYANDNCGIASRLIRRMDDNCNTPGNLIFGPQVKFCCADVGEVVMVIFQAIDFAGNISTCMIQVNVHDKTPPVALCKDACIFLDDEGSVILQPGDIDNGSTDNCAVTDLDLSQTNFDCADIGFTVVILTVSDQSGNTATCTALVEVKDTIPPQAECRDITIELNEMGMIEITVFMIDDGSTDNCGIDTMYLSQYEFDCSDIGDNEVDLIVIDQGGLADTCTAIVTIEDMPPMVMCMDVTVYLDENGEVMITPDDVDGVSDDCSMPNRDLDIDFFDCTDIGDNVVVLTATDDSGNTATCSAIVTVLDTIAPLCDAMDLTIQLDADGSVTLAGNALDNGSSDNCEIESITINPNTFDCDNTDAAVLVVQTVTDVSGNSSTCTAFVTVEDNLDPICLTQNIVVQLNAAGMATISNNAVNNGSSDNCGIESIVLSQTQFDCEDVGIVVVTQTVTDVNGNTSTCTAQITVEDNIDPICVTEDITIQLDADGEVTISNNAVDNGSSDACGIQSITLTPTTFDCDDIGVVIVTQTVTDVNGNTSTCTAEVTVEDNVAPICLTQDITVELGPDGTVTIEGDAVDDGSSDNCGDITISVDPNTFDCGSPDIVVVVQTVTDASGNTSTCTANVTVIGGDEPVAECQDITVFLDENGQVIIDPADVDDGSFSLCGDIELEVDPDQFDCDGIGDHTVTLTVTDITGSTATCTAIVTVQDTLAPLCLVQDVTVFLDANGVASIDVADIDVGISDNCEVATVLLTPDEFDCEDAGEDVIVIVTVTDVNGNTSTCSAEVTVIDDIAPLCVAQDITIQLDGAGNATITADQIDNGSSDNCDDITLSVNPSTFDCEDIGENEVVLTVTDASGNTSTCTAIVTVEDSGELIANCQNLIVSLDANGQVIVLPEDVDNGSGGGCLSGDLTFELDESVFDCSEIGANIVTLTVTDSEGNSATCTAIITVVDDTPPSLICPTNMTADCDDPIDIEDLSQFGTPISSDNCPPVTIVEEVEDNRDECGQGTIVRTFTATDPSGNSVQCMQTITISDPDPFDVTDIIWPPAIVNLGQCSSTDPGPGNQPVIDSGTCTNLSVSYSDMVTMTVDNNPLTPCIEITREWLVIDSCQLDDGEGIFEFTQMIILNDNVGPVFSPILNDVTVTADPVTCEAFVNLVTNASDCGMATPVTNDYNAGGGNASDNFPIGTTTVIFTSTDDCGNISTMDVNITVLDPDPPGFECHKIIRFLDDFEITVYAGDFVTFTDGACSDLEDFLFSYSPTDPFDSLQTFMCQHVGVEPVDIYTFDLNGDPVDTCRGDLDLRDTMNICGDGLVITGEIYLETKEMIANVPVLISDPLMQNVSTRSNGRYFYLDLIQGNNYELTPFWNVNHRHGVTTLDLIAMQKHLLGIKPLDSPYKLIAADANNNGSITIADLLEVRRLVLNLIAEYTHNTSWRFVDAHFEFPDPQNPWALAFPERMSFAPLMEDKENMDFIAVKIGDVNNTAANLHDEDVDVRSSNAMVLHITDQFLRAGESYEIPVTVDRYQDLIGYQFAIQGEPSKVHIENVDIPLESFLAREWFGLNQQDADRVSNLWFETESRTLQAGTVLFTIGLKSIESGWLSEILRLDEGTVDPQAYNSVEQVVPLRLSIDGEVHNPDFAVFQNVPNPFTKETIIPVQIPEPSAVLLEVYAYDGRLVHRQVADVEKGYHEFVINEGNLERGGMYYYTISTERFRGTRKMIMLE